MQALAIPAAFVSRLDEERPNIAVAGVADCKRYDLTLPLDDPTASPLLEGRRVVRFGDRCGSETVLAHGKANAMHSRDIFASCLAQDGVHQARTFLFGPYTAYPSARWDMQIAYLAGRLNRSRSAFSPAVEKLTTRDPFGRRAQPRSKHRLSTAAPTAPAR